MKPKPWRDMMNHAWSSTNCGCWDVVPDRDKKDYDDHYSGKSKNK